MSKTQFYLVIPHKIGSEQLVLKSILRILDAINYTEKRTPITNSDQRNTLAKYTTKHCRISNLQEIPLFLSLPPFSRRGNRTLPSLLEQNWHNTQNDRDTDDNGLDTEYKTQSIPSNPGRLEVSDGETTAGAPHVEDRGDDGRLFGVFLQGVGCDGTMKGRC
jgi:hypothetical protein